MKVAAVTPTRNRPRQLELCRHYVARQTHSVVAHVVVEAELDLGPNLYTALSRVPADTDIVCVFEDDDWYHPTYVERVVAEFASQPSAKVLGVARYAYYRWPDGTYREHNTRGAALAVTSFRAACSERVQDWCFWEHKHLDTRIWNDLELRPTSRFVGPYAPMIALGMKGLGGPGYGRAHAGPDRSLKHRDDDERSWLRDVIGAEDLARYREVFPLTAASPTP